jgi:hypothetical protein
MRTSFKDVILKYRDYVYIENGYIKVNLEKFLPILNYYFKGNTLEEYLDKSIKLIKYNTKYKLSDLPIFLYLKENSTISENIDIIEDLKAY